MLSSLQIENVAVIQKAEVHFKPGLNVLTGETGAGKSILIDSINAILGNRTSKDLVRTGASKAVIRAAFEQVPDAVLNSLEKAGYERSDALMLSREITAEGKSTCRINGMPATASVLRELCGGLININGQHDSVGLLNPARHLGILDDYAQNNAEFQEYYVLYRELVRIKRELDAMITDEAEKQRKIDLLSYQVQEIEDAALTEGEEETLNARRKVLAQQLYCIETLARVDVLCLDKTGTITSGRMEVEGTYPLPVEGVGFGVDSDEAAVPVDTTVLDFALANVARATSADANETCQALLNYYADRPVEVSEPLSVIPFSSSKKWSGASFAQGSYVMGAAQFVLSERVFSQVENRVAELADTCRVLVVARVDGFTPDGDMVGEAEPVGFVTIRDEIRTSAAETIGYFNEQGVTLNVISGDDPRTVSSIARVASQPSSFFAFDTSA